MIATTRIIFRSIPLGALVANAVLFLYFFTSCAERLFFNVFLFKPKLNNCIALLLFCFFVAVKKRLILKPSLVAPSCLILFSLCISTLLSPYIARSAGYVAIFCIDFTLYFLLPYNMMLQMDKRSILTLYAAAFWCVGLHASAQLGLSLLGIIDPFCSQRFGPLVRPNALAYEPSYYALYMTPFVAFLHAEYLFNRKGVLQKRGLLRLGASHLIYFVSTATSSFFGAVLFFPIEFLMKPLTSPRYFWRKTSALLAAMCSAIAVGFFSMPKLFTLYFFKFFSSRFFIHQSFSERWEGIVRGWELFKQFPLFGKGIGSFGAYYYYLYHDLQTQTPLDLTQLERYDATNVLTELLGCLGVFGVCAMLFLFWVCAKDIRAIARLPDTFYREKTTALALATSWLAAIIVLQFNQGLFRHYIWIHSGIVLGYIHSVLLTANTAQSTRQAHGA